MEFISQMEPDYGNEEKQAVSNYLDSGGFITEFKKTRELEQMIADYTGVKYCSIVHNGTVTMFLSLKALNVVYGDEVIVPDYTMVATANAVVLCGATPIFVDIEEDSLCLNPELLKNAITPKTKAVIFVSINGRAGRLAEVKKICDEHQLPLIEDAAQSLGSKYQGKHLGTYGIAGSLSFSMPKIITMGQGGAVITDNQEVYERVLKLKDFGRKGSGGDFYETMGWNFKFTDLQAVFGIEQFKKLDGRVSRKKEMWRLYAEGFKDIKEVRFIQENLEETTPWFIEIFAPNPGKLQLYLKENNIGSRPIYPALHRQPVYNLKGSFPVAEKVAKQGLWLPSSLKLTDEQIEYICQKIKEFYG